MILPTVTFMTTDSLRAVPVTTGSEYGHGSDLLANHLACHLEARSGVNLYSSCLWYGACLRGSLWRSRWWSETRQWSQPSLTTPASTLTSILTMGIGNTVMGTVNNNVLWSLALVLLLMSLAFNSVIKLITKERGKKNYAR